MLFDIGYADGILPCAGGVRSPCARRNQGGIMLTDCPPRKSNLAGFQESDRRETLDLPQDGHLLVAANFINTGMLARFTL